MVSVGLSRLINAIDNIKKMIDRRARLSSLLDALTMGVFQNLQITATEIRVETIPNAPNVRTAIPPALEYWKLAKGKSTHAVLALLECFPSGHSIQVGAPGTGLIVPRGHGMHSQQQGEVVDCLVPGEHWSRHSDFGKRPVWSIQRMFSFSCKRLETSHFPTITPLRPLAPHSCTCWKLVMS